MNKKSKMVKIGLLILVILILVAIIIYIYPTMKNLSSSEGKIELKEKIESLGVLGIVVLFALQVAQIFLFIIPGEPIEILAGMCYGSIGGCVFIMLSSAIISAIIFILVRKYGRKFIYSFCKKEKIEKFENSKLFKNERRIEIIILILFLLPGTPKDLLVYIGALLPIPAMKFIVISTISRIPSIISSTIVGANIMNGNWKISILIYAVVFILVCIIICIINRFDKTKSTKDVIDTLKATKKTRDLTD